MRSDKFHDPVHSGNGDTASADALRSSTELAQRRSSRLLLGTRVDAVSMESAVYTIVAAAKRRVRAMVCVANVHMIVEAYNNQTYRDQLNSADLTVPDGMPLVWLLRRYGSRSQERVAGPDLMPHVCAMAAKSGLSVGILGGKEATLRDALQALTRANPELHVAYAYSPPFRELDADEDRDLVNQINASGASILFVALGCPKQERWMQTHQGRVEAVMIGIGAALDFVGGAVPRAPRLMRRSGLEWLFRLYQEPGRLWRRYATTIPAFIGLALVDTVKTYQSRPQAQPSSAANTSI